MNKFHYHSHQLLVPAAADVCEYPPQHPPACRLASAASLTSLPCFALIYLPSCLSTPLKYSRIRRENYLSVLGRNCSFKFFLPLAHSFVSKLSVPTTTPSSKCDRIRQQIFFPLQLEILLTSRSSLVPWKQRLGIRVSNQSCLQ